MRTIRKEEYYYLGRYKSPLLYHWLLPYWVNHDEGERRQFPQLDGRLLLLDGHLFLYQSDWQSIRKAASQAINEKNSEFFRAIFDLIEREIADTVKAADGLQQNPNAQPEDFDAVFQKFRKMEYPWFFVLPINEVMGESVVAALKENNLPESALQNFFDPSPSTLLLQQQRDASALKREMVDRGIFENNRDLSWLMVKEQLEHEYPDMYQKMERHVDEYKWFGMMHMWGAPFSLSKLWDQMITLPGVQEKILVTIPSELTWLKEETQKLSYWRNHVAEACSIISYKILEQLERASSRMGLSYELSAWLTPKEFLNGVSGKPIPEKDVIEERKRGFGLIGKNGELEILTGKELADVIESVLETVEATDEVHGQVANRGRATGRAKIVLSPADTEKVKRGDIMISGETTPDFVLAASRAAALVTDIGGITSHAAIISRELGIPCIVGTRFATRIFRDDDLIEVDASRGTVRKIKE